MKIPAAIFQGDDIVWRDVAGFDSLGNSVSAPDFDLRYYFAGPTSFYVDAVAYGSGWETSLTAEQTAGMKSALSPNYYWQALATKEGSAITLGSGRVQVVKALASAEAGYDGRTQNEKDYDAVLSAIRARISGGVVAEYAIGNRRLRNEPMSALIELRDNLKFEIARERRSQRIQNGQGDMRTTFVTFGG